MVSIYRVTTKHIQKERERDISRVEEFKSKSKNESENTSVG